MDDAIGMTPGYDGWKNTNLIKGIRPCEMGNNGEILGYYINKEDMSQGYTQTLAGSPVNSDTMIEFPLMGYKLWNDDSYQYVSVTDDPNAEDKGYCYYAHSLNTEKDCDKIYIGAFLGFVNSFVGIKLHSISSLDGGNVTPTANTSLVDFRTYAANRGSGYSLISFFPWTLLQCLYVIIYKNLNSQNALGIGYQKTGTTFPTLGTTLSQPFCYGDPNDNTKHVKFLGIEDFYGGLRSWLDGMYSDSSRNILTDYRNSQFVGSEHNFQFSTPSGLSSNIYNNIKSIQGTNTTGFIFKSTDSNGKFNTYFSDYGNVSSNTFGECGNLDYLFSGAFSMQLAFSASYSFKSLGSRLMYKHLASSGTVTPEPDVLNVTCYDLSRILDNNITTYPQWKYISCSRTDEGSTKITFEDLILTNEESVELLCFFDTLTTEYAVFVGGNEKYPLRPIDININIDCSEYLQKRDIANYFANNIISKDNEFYNAGIVSIIVTDFENRYYTIEIPNNTNGTPEFEVYYCSLVIPTATFEQYLNSDKTLNIKIVYTDESYPIA